MADEPQFIDRFIVRQRCDMILQLISLDKWRVLEQNDLSDFFQHVTISDKNGFHLPFFWIVRWIMLIDARTVLCQ